MTLDPLEQLDLSELPDYDANAEYGALLRALRRQQGFGILFVRCSPSQGSKLIADLQRDLPKKRCSELTLTEPLADGDFFGCATTFVAEHPADVVFVQGMEHSLLDYEETKRQSGWTKAEIQNYSWKDVPPILRNLNQQRDRFRNELPVCFVFLVPLFLVKYLKRRAPDFFDWRSGVFTFKDSRDSLVQQIKECFLEDYTKVRDMPHNERLLQAIRIRDLLEESPLSPDEKFRLLFDHGIIQIVDGAFNDAQISWAKSLDVPITTADNLNLKGQVLDTLGRYEEAITSYNQAVKIKPNYPEAWYSRGNTLFNSGRFEEAIVSYDQAVEIKPEYPEVWYYRGTALFNLGRYQEAIASYDQALRIKPQYPEAWTNRGAALFDLGFYEKAITSYERAIKLQPDYYRAWHNRGNALFQLGRYEEAINSYERVVELQPNEPRIHDVWHSRGSALGKLGRYEEAINSYDQALEIKPDYHEALHNRGIVLGKLGQGQESLASLSKAFELNPRATIDLSFDRLNLPLPNGFLLLIKKLALRVLLPKQEKGKHRSL